MPIDVPQPFWDRPAIIKDTTDFANGINTEIIHSKKLYDASVKTVSFAAYTSSDEDSVSGLAGNVGSPVVVQVGYKALLANTTATGGASGKATVFIGGNQMSTIVNPGPNVLAETNLDQSVTSAYAWLLSTPTGFTWHGPIAADASDVTTGVTLSAGPLSGGITNYLVPSCPADGFSVAVRFKATNTGLQRKERHLWVRVLTFR
jgi:hypothetical protein